MVRAPTMRQCYRLTQDAASLGILRRIYRSPVVDSGVHMWMVDAEGGEESSA